MMNELFGRIATRVAHYTGRPIVFATACLLLVVWAATGPFAGYSDAWQLVVNTATTIITFLMVFLIQNTQNRDSLAVQIKLDELIRAVDKARDNFIDLETLSEKQLDALHERLSQLGTQARGGRDEGPDVESQKGETDRASTELDSGSVSIRAAPIAPSP
jgi:low affinity Fe/Cu permease